MIEQGNRLLRDDLISLERFAKGDGEAWKMVNDNERCAIYKERNKTKLRFVKKFNWIRDKQRCHILGLRQGLAKNAMEKKRRKNAGDPQRFRKRQKTRKMQAVLAEAQKMILNKSSIELDDHDKAFITQRSETPTPNWSQSIENAEWLNIQQHVRRTERSAVLGEKHEGDFVLPKQLNIPKLSRPESGKIDEETKTYVEMVCTKLRSIKPLVLKAYPTKNNLSKEQRKCFTKLAKPTEERKIVIDRANKDGKIVILNYEDYDVIMTIAS